MNAESDPFDCAEMSDAELASCVDALLSTYGAHAGPYILRSIEASETDDAKWNWVRIGYAYAQRLEPIMMGSIATELDLKAGLIPASDRLH